MVDLDRAYLKHNRYENLLSRSIFHDDLIGKAFSGSSRSVRLSTVEENEGKQVIWDTGANVIGPLYLSFVWWLLKKAQSDGVLKLYFLARDGLILKEIADILSPLLDIKIENHYLFVSRQSLLYPSIIDVDDFDVRWLMWNPLMSLTPRIILERLEISESDVFAELRRYKITDLKRPLTLKEKSEFRNFFYEPKVKELIKTKSQIAFETTSKYLQQEGMADGKPFGVVDLGWAGLSQYAISRILDKSQCRAKNGVAGYYLGLNWLLRKYKNDRADAFLFDPSNLLWRIPLVEYSLYEIFATLEQGRTISYRNIDGRIVPIQDEKNDEAQRWGCEIQKRSVLAFVQRILKILPQGHLLKYCPTPKIGKLFNSFCNHPSVKEAESYGCFLHGADIKEKEKNEIAPKIKLKNFVKILTGYYWVQGTIVRSGFIGKFALIKLFVCLNALRHIILSLIDRCLYRTIKCK